MFKFAGELGGECAEEKTVGVIVCRVAALEVLTFVWLFYVAVTTAIVIWAVAWRGWHFINENTH